MDTDSSRSASIPLKFKLLLLSLVFGSFVSGLVLITPKTDTQAADATPREVVWQSVPSMPVPVFEAQGIVVANKLYVFGGFYTDDAQAFDQSYIFDPKDNSWVANVPLPEPITHGGMTADETNIYMAGGFVGSHPGPMTNHVWKFDTTTSVWSQMTPLPKEIAAGALVRVGRNLHFFGGGLRNEGNNEIGQDSGEHWVLNIDTGTEWVKKADMPDPRNHLAGVSVHGKVYAIGGQHLEGAHRENQDSVHVYDPQTDEWRQAAYLPIPLGHIASAAFVMDDQILVVGGFTNPFKISSNVYRYNPKTNQWVTLSEMPEALQSAVAGTMNNSLYITTGKNALNKMTSSTYQGSFKLQ